LLPFAEDEQLGAKVRYWRGFAQWRRAFNRFNDSMPPGELQKDLQQAVTEFEAAVKKEPGFVDAEVAAGSSLGLLMFLFGQNPTLAPDFRDRARVMEVLQKALAYQNEAEAAEPENPRVLWVVGRTRWNLPPQLGGGQDKAIEGYEKGLKAIRGRKAESRDPLMPSWGEAELLMNMAYSHMAQTTPDLVAAERYARSALALVPHWQYVKDILLPQIAAAKLKVG
jgi:hypothetical protein